MTYDYKQDFPIFQHTDVAYIDNAATAQRPQCVLDAVADFYRCHNANPLRGLYPLSVEATDIYEQARETVRDFIGARSAREIVFTRNTTESLNLVAYSYGLTHAMRCSCLSWSTTAICCRGRWSAARRARS